MRDAQHLLDEGFMRLALDQAHSAALAGEVPVGAVVVRQGRVIASAHNSPLGSIDPCAHAEVNALRAAAKALGNYRLEDCTLYVTLEPCLMCSGAVLASRLGRLVFGATEPKTGAAGSVLNVFTQPQLNHQTQTTGGVLGAESAALLQSFFEERRKHHDQQRVPLREDALRLSDAATAAMANLGVPAQFSRYTQSLPALQGLRLHWLQNAVPPSFDAEMQVFLHGPNDWSAAYLDALHTGQAAVAVDLPGFGLSDKPKKETLHSVAWYAQVLAEFLALHTAKSFVLAAPHSMKAVLAHVQEMNLPNVSVLTLGASPPMAQALRHAPYQDKGHEAGPRALRALLSASSPVRH